MVTVCYNPANTTGGHIVPLNAEAAALLAQGFKLVATPKKGNPPKGPKTCQILFLPIVV